MLLRRQLNEPGDDHIDMTPMVDVVFQLMTFMLFSTTVTGGEKVQVPPARHGVGVEEDSATFLTLFPATAAGGEARVALGNGGGPPATAEQIRDYVADGVREGRRRVVLQADGAVPHGEVVRLAAAVAGLEGVSLHVGVQEPQ